MFQKKDESGYQSPVEGICMKTLVYGDNSLLTQFQLKKGGVLPKHTHPQEQTGYMISGRILLVIDDEEFVAEPGDSWSIPGNIEHWAEILEDSVAIEVFSPVREDYLP